jgi:hypothetical protein
MSTPVTFAENFAVMVNGEMFVGFCRVDSVTVGAV